MIVGLDLGSAHIGVRVGPKGEVKRQPAVVATDSRTRKAIAIGERAQRMLGRTGHSVEVVRPVEVGLAARPDLVATLVRQVLKDSLGWRIALRPRLHVAVPITMTSMEKEALQDALTLAGAGTAEWIPTPLAAARGAGADVASLRGWMVADFGARQTQAALIFMGRLMAQDSIPVGGRDLDFAVARHLRQSQNLAIGSEQAESLKMQLGIGEGASALVTGRDVESGLPITKTISSADIRTATMPLLQQYDALLQRVLAQTPAELATDILDNQILLTGGGARLRGLTDFLSQQTRLPFYLPDQPECCTVMGSTTL